MKKTSFALSTFFKSKILLNKIKIRLYTHGDSESYYVCEAWTTSVTERRLTTFENKKLRMICGPKLDANTGIRKRKLNKELIEGTGMAPIKNYVRGQRIKWFGHIMCGNDGK